MVLDLDGFPNLQSLDLCECLNINLRNHCGKLCKEPIKNLRLPGYSMEDHKVAPYDRLATLKKKRWMPKYMPKMTTSETSKGKTRVFGLNYPILTKENYTAWAMKMGVFMKAHGVWDVVEPSDPKSVVDERTDKVALAMIYQGIP
ncbi:hypothetical protein AgCh_028312 [Apium graveolens]